jgi:hypothetical protein
MDDHTIFDLFDSLKRQMKQESDALRQELHPTRDALERIEARLISDEAEILRIISGEHLR